MSVAPIVLGRGTPAQRTVQLASPRTLAQDVWLTRVTRLAELDTIELPQGEAVTPEAFSTLLTSLVEKIFEANLVVELLAGVLAPIDGRWTTAWAHELTAQLLDEQDEDVKRTLLGLLSQIIADFCRGDRPRLTSSPSSSSA